MIKEITKTLLADINTIVNAAGDRGINAVCLADDIAGNKGLFFSMSYFTDIIFPIYNDIAAIIKGKGLFAFFHSDGDMTKVIEFLIRARYDCVHPVDAQAGMDINTPVGTFGERISFMGHIDIMAWTEERIKEEIGLAQQRFRKGGLLLGSTCGLSMKTLGPGARALYPGLEREEERP